MQPTLNGKTVVVTGANSGIGRAMAGQLAELGAHVAIVCRNPERGTEALEALTKRAGRQCFELCLADLCSMAEVRRVARELREKHPKIDVLVNNAGVYLPRRQLSP